MDSVVNEFLLRQKNSSVIHLSTGSYNYTVSHNFISQSQATTDATMICLDPSFLKTQNL